MLKYLENILGKPIKYYELLMSSKTEKVDIKESDIEKVLDAMRPHILPSKVYKIDSGVYDVMELNKSINIPKNKKKEPLPLKGTFILNDEVLFLFVNEEKVVKDFSNYSLIIQKLDNYNQDSKLALSQQAKTIQDTLPIWEEIIHRFPEVHQLIISLNPQNPWTLYKNAVKQYKNTDHNIVLGGYPQWRINNVDYRKIKDLIFIMEYKIDEKNFSIFFLKDPKNQNIITIEQKD